MRRTNGMARSNNGRAWSFTIVAALMLLSSRADAEGALAVGSTGNVAKDGIAVGTAVNYKTREEAVATALERCRNYKQAPRSAETCQLVDTFTRECYALAYDPQPGTSGAGWAFGPSGAAAEHRALAACQIAAGKERAQYCAIKETKCDESD